MGSLSGHRAAGGGRALHRRAAYTPALPDYEAAGFEDASPAPVGWRVSGEGEGGLLGQLNDRLKTQARRYPHPITNEMEDFS